MMLSIGEQTIPLEFITHAIQAIQQLFDSKTLSICISSLNQRTGPNRLQELERAYNVITGKAFPWESIFLTERSYVSAGRAASDPRMPRRQIPILQLCKDRGCFYPTVGAVVVPTPLIKTDGRVYACSVFGMPDELLLGNIFQTPLVELLHGANSNRYISLLAQGSLPAVAKGIPMNKLKET